MSLAPGWAAYKAADGKVSMPREAGGAVVRQGCGTMRPLEIRHSSGNVPRRVDLSSECLSSECWLAATARPAASRSERRAQLKRARSCAVVVAAAGCERKKSFRKV